MVGKCVQLLEQGGQIGQDGGSDWGLVPVDGGWLPIADERGVCERILQGGRSVARMCIECSSLLERAPLPCFQTNIWGKSPQFQFFWFHTCRLHLTLMASGMTFLAATWATALTSTQSLGRGQRLLSFAAPCIGESGVASTLRSVSCQWLLHFLPGNYSFFHHFSSVSTRTCTPTQDMYLIYSICVWTCIYTYYIYPSASFNLYMYIHIYIYIHSYLYIHIYPYFIYIYKNTCLSIYILI